MECPEFLVLGYGSNKGKYAYSSSPEAEILLYDF